MKIPTGPIDMEKIQEDSIIASIALMVLDPYKAKHDAIHGDNYFMTREMYEAAKEEIYSTLEAVEKEVAPIDAQITRMRMKGDLIENEDVLGENLRRIFAICDYCLSYKGDIDLGD